MDAGQARREVWLLRVLCGHGGPGYQGENGLVEAAAGEHEGEVGEEEIECPGGPDQEKRGVGEG